MNDTSFPGYLDSDICSRIVDAIGAEFFFPRIAKLIERHIHFEGLFVILYSKNRAPSSLGCFKISRNYQPGLENYLKYTYVLNPVYRAIQQDIPPATYLISDLVPTGYDDQIALTDIHIWIDREETIGYRTPGWPKHMTEVLGLVRLPDNKMVELCFLTSQPGDQTERCHSALKTIYPVLSSAIRKHFEFAVDDSDTSKTRPSQEDQFQDFGKETLTERERSVVRMILTGRSSNSIALILGISLPTVKSHRRNIYAKLHISSQAELFSLFVRKLMENPQ